MKIRVEKLGILNKGGDVTLNNLTLFCGPNNTGKTYTMYTLYTLLNKKFKANFKFVDDIVKDISINGICYYDLETIINKHFNEMLGQIEKGIHQRLPAVFGVNSEKFKSTKLYIKIEQSNLLTAATERPWQARLNLSSKTFLEIEKPEHHTQIIFTLREPKSIPSHILVEFISEAITHFVFPQMAGHCFLLPAERAGLNLFFKELSSIRNRLLHHAQKDNINPLEVLKDIITSRYAEPISDYIEYLGNLTTIKKQKSDYQKQVQYIQKKIINGKYEIDRYGDIFFLPYRSKETKMPLHFTSSTVKTLFGLVFYLEHQTKVDYLMIDEPELSLHPDNQRNLARVLVQLVNSGINVIVSTHSPYFVRELNNLIMLSKPSAKIDHLREKYGYDKNEYLKFNSVSAYLFDKEEITQMEIDPNEGIIAETFDQVINNLNQSSNDIYFSSQAEEASEDVE